MYSFWDIALQNSQKSGGYVIKINKVNIVFRIALNRI